MFVTKERSNPFLAGALAQGVTAMPIPQRSSYDRRAVAHLDAICRKTQADVLVTHDYKANLMGRRVATELGIPVVAVVHGYTGESRRVRLFETWDRRMLRRLAGVVAVSDAMESRLLRCKVHRDRLHRIENTIDADSIAMAALSARAETRGRWVHEQDETLVLTLGRLSPEKGHSDLVDALKSVQGRWRLIIVGDGPREAVLRAAVKQADLVSRVHFAGWVSDGASALGAADIFVLPSHTEGLPLALLEAMAVGLPIVATRVGGVPKALRDGDCGVLVDPGSPAQIARALNKLIADPSAAKQLGDAAAKRVRTHYGAETQVRALEALYRSVVTGAEATSRPKRRAEA